MPLAEEIVAHLSWPLLGLLFLMLLAAAAVFSVLISRETSRRRWVELREWARIHGAKLHRVQPLEIPESLAFLLPQKPQVLVLLVSADWTLVELSSAGLPSPPSSSRQPARWRILLRRIEADWPATALRPTTHLVSLVDPLELSSYPSLASGTRFVVFGSSATAARALANSALETLLPPDIGLLLAGNFLMLDFSPRPFDTIEFGRMLALSQQLVQHLPQREGVIS